MKFGEDIERSLVYNSGNESIVVDMEVYGK